LKNSDAKTSAARLSLAQRLRQRRVARGALLFVGGQIGWNAQQQFESDDFVAQARQVLLNIVAVLKAGGAGSKHMVRMIWHIVDTMEYLARLKELGGVYRVVMGRNFPAMTCVRLRVWLKRVRWSKLRSRRCCLTNAWGSSFSSRRLQSTTHPGRHKKCRPFSHDSELFPVAPSRSKLWS
jgi:enamine deaminase RidA (YjgF/YER057c/UK114 family)